MYQRQLEGLEMRWNVGSIRVALALHWVAAEWRMISGTITTRDVLLHASTILRSFGLGTLVRCLRALLTGRRTTFLELAWPR
ncbi:MAG TPA: hypothetical protein VKB87_16955 [Myxococcaceae bacterium]|nr:hypothetical protein [Myxococcaceae bacterium]